MSKVFDSIDEIPEYEKREREWALDRRPETARAIKRGPMVTDPTSLDLFAWINGEFDADQDRRAKNRDAAREGGSRRTEAAEELEARVEDEASTIRRSRPWSPEWSTRWMAKTIARRVGRPVSTVRGVLRRLGLR